jgi:NAD(P)-dependent dehydrogenase (short-subunit alcohol dehydrogenase family)
MAFGFDLSGKVVVVTGAFSGLGLHFSKTLAAEGCLVAMCGRRIELGSTLAAAIRDAGDTAVAFELDVTDASSVASCLSSIRERFGVPDVLVNNAGVAHHAPAFDTTDEAWSQTLNVNLTGVWRLSRMFASELFKAGKGGSIVNIASILGLRVAQQVVAYAVCKAGVIQMTKALALEWARHKIRVNAIAPGYFETDLNKDFFETNAGLALIKRIPMRRLGQLQELDGPVLLLTSDASAFMNGAVLCVDGGHMVSSL